MRRMIVTAVAVVAVVGVISGCSSSGSGGGSPTTGAAGGTGTASAGTTKVTVGIIPILDVAPIYLGQKKGLFAKHGISLTLKTAQGGAAIVPAVISGQYQFGFSNMTSLILRGRVDRGAGQGLRRRARESVRKAGGDPKSVKFVELAFPDVLAALASHRVAAAQVVEPFFSGGVAQGDRLVASNYVDTADKLTIAGYFATTKEIGSKADLVKNFTAAMTGDPN